MSLHELWRWKRLRLGTKLIRLGLAVMPTGRAKTELTSLFWVWSTKIIRETEGVTDEQD